MYYYVIKCKPIRLQYANAGSGYQEKKLNISYVCFCFYFLTLFTDQSKRVRVYKYFNLVLSFFYLYFFIYVPCAFMGLLVFRWSSQTRLRRLWMIPGKMYWLSFTLHGVATARNLNRNIPSLDRRWTTMTWNIAAEQIWSTLVNIPPCCSV